MRFPIWIATGRFVAASPARIVQPDDGRLIPFDTFNLFYRDDLESTVLAGLGDTTGTDRGRLRCTSNDAG